MSTCACGSQENFDVCCEPILKGSIKAPTAERLMRSRYTAFTRADIDYIENSTDPSMRQTFDRDGTLEWAKSSDWCGLEIKATEAGSESDTKGVVEFIAKYKYDGKENSHHERAEFRKRDGQWFFLDGRLVQEPFRAEEKIGRNDPCLCGSGKKFKKCCGA